MTDLMIAAPAVSIEKTEGDLRTDLEEPSAIGKKMTAHVAPHHAELRTQVVLRRRKIGEPVLHQEPRQVA